LAVSGWERSQGMMRTRAASCPARAVLIRAMWPLWSRLTGQMISQLVLMSRCRRAWLPANPAAPVTKILLIEASGHNGHGATDIAA
jgi:hypothetical protein